MSRPVVSIIVPCYNAEPWLAATLESALAQTWPETETIFVDDGSTDGSLGIAAKYEARGVRVFAQKNSGASAARNQGLAAARGDFIQYLDADDLLHPRKIETQLSLLETRGPGLVASGRWGRFESDPNATRFVDAPVFCDLEPLAFLRLAAGEGHMMHPAAWLTPRDVADTAGPWDESLSLNDDGEYFARVVLASRGIAFCGEAESYYRSNLTGSLSGRNDEKAQRSLFRSAELIAPLLLKAEDTPVMRQAIAAVYLRVLHAIYPAPRDLLAKVYARIAEFGGRVTPPPMGPRSAAMAGMFGWKLTRRLQTLLSR